VLTGEPPFVDIRSDMTVMTRIMAGERPGRPSSLTITYPVWELLVDCWDQHRRQRSFCGARKTYTKPSTFVKYVIKFVGTANPIPNFEFVEEYVKNNKRIKYFKFFFRAYRIPHLEFVSHARFEFDEIAKPFKYLYYWE